MKKFLPFYLMTFAAILSCQEDNNLNTAEDPTIFRDQYGRQLILHGLNTSSSAKYHPERQPWILESDVDREDKEFGFNFVRYLIFWDGIEPERDVYDEAYLDKVEERVEWYTSRGLHVMLDMHQDLYSIAFGGDGAPLWAIQANGYPVNAENPYGDQWFMKSLDPAVVAAFRNFWQYTNYKELQDHYILAWKKVAERFKDNPYVLGYDLMNEPYPGDLGSGLSGTFEKTQLYQFYNRLIPAIRSVDQEKYIIFEPTSIGINQGLACNLPEIRDTRSTPRLGYAPHCYPLFIEAIPGPYGPAERAQLLAWEKERNKDIKKFNCPLIIGETGINPAETGFDTYLNDVFDYLDSIGGGIAYWSNDHGSWSPLNADRSETPVCGVLIRTYPKAIQGKATRIKYNAATKVFNMTFNSNAAISQPTEIFIPERYYPAGYDLTVTGTSNYTQEYDAVKHLLKLKVNENAEVSVEITKR